MLPSSHEPQSTVFFPPYLLQDLFEHLDPLDLITCKRVCTLWYSIIHCRNRLRQKLFLPPSNSSPSSDKACSSKSHLVNSPDEVYDLHPIFNLIHFDASLDPAATSFGRPPQGEKEKCKMLIESEVKDHYATYPATIRVEMDLIHFHPHLVVENDSGVKVWDVMVALAKYKEERTHFTFQTFFPSDICKKRGYELRRKMRRRDLLGIDSVFITFNDRDPDDGRVFIGDSFESWKGVAIGKRYRFWSAFAFCEFPLRPEW
ncbi:hypothetical protein L873DRAFT_1677381 [Choiromyces venosus 120613-1]|uniref:F-box domain-containing protein n=1 Tax=Choiromyces venosus 120613-1 TaxID=1336337 RepID=A0A3N4JSL4_9PEZI|nr:hypothetical protein L873DRAFT_1677381 [Choiromyces venosus 120613-1]